MLARPVAREVTATYQGRLTPYLRAVFVAKGARNIAPIIGFFEILVWITIIGQIFAQANDKAFSQKRVP